MTDGITHNTFGCCGVPEPLQPDTLTHTKYDITQPASVGEDTEATMLAVQALSTAMQKKMFLSYQNGWAGWNRASECTTHRLVELFDVAVKKGDVVDIANYAMMLYARNVTNVQLHRLEIERAELAATLHELIQVETMLREQRDGAVASEVCCLLDDQLDQVRNTQHELQRRWCAIQHEIQKGA